MTDGVGSAGNSLPTITDTSPLQNTSTVGSKDGQKVEAVPPNLQLNQLNPSATTDQSIDQRSAEGIEGVIPTPGLAQPEEVINESYEELQEVEDKLLKDVGGKLKESEEFRVLDLALRAFDGEKVDSRHKLKVTLELPKEPPPPEKLTLVPASKEVKNRPDYDGLVKLAKTLLVDHRADNFSGFDYQGTQEQVKKIQEDLTENATKMGKKDPSRPSDWKAKFGKLEQTQAYFEAKDTHGRTAEVEAASKKSLPENLRFAQIEVETDDDDSFTEEDMDTSIASAIQSGDVLTPEELQQGVQDGAIGQREVLTSQTRTINKSTGNMTRAPEMQQELEAALQKRSALKMPAPPQLDQENVDLATTKKVRFSDEENPNPAITKRVRFADQEPQKKE